jgi:hypothetical protein
MVPWSASLSFLQTSLHLTSSSLLVFGLKAHKLPHGSLAEGHYYPRYRTSIVQRDLKSYGLSILDIYPLYILTDSSKSSAATNSNIVFSLSVRRRGADELQSCKDQDPNFCHMYLSTHLSMKSHSNLHRL